MRKFSIPSRLALPVVTQTYALLFARTGLPKAEQRPRCCRSFTCERRIYIERGNECLRYVIECPFLNCPGCGSMARRGGSKGNRRTLEVAETLSESGQPSSDRISRILDAPATFRLMTFKITVTCQDG
ncbi:hypothetical protein SCHPADRAFT_563414 [Schizopora paradoxa]|uniref:Uncharacterized protein n=1 Tax=Schizopora paradoxa TaxID=27342 RepID=A0A0H2RCH8_9AGAM|nr:hypothetical protein SCHPADRAFT_563414 [Schizopora paradoxa]